jgi:hypothetical protein
MKFTDKSKWQTGAKEEAAPTRSKVIINEPDFIAQVMLKSSQNNIFVTEEHHLIYLNKGKGRP